MGALTQLLQAVTLHDAGVFFLDTVVKATALLMLACVMAAVLRRASAAVRHRVWSLAFCGLLALPLLSTLLPGWRLPILPDLNELADATLDEGARVEATDSAGEPKLLPGDSLGPELALDPHDPRWMQMHPDSLDGRLDAPDTPVDAGEVAATSTAQRNTAAESAPAEATLAASVSVGTTDRRRFSRLLSVVWLLGMCLVLLPVLVSLIHNRLLGKSARTVVDAEESRLLAELCNSLRVKRSVRLLETGKSLVPMTWGVLRPIVLFPMAWRQWSADRRRFALLHELAHVKRCDVAFQLLARMTCALYWFHPLAWYALRRMRIERELACDDCVLLVSDRPSDYAQQLVEIARSYRLISMPAAVAMASTTNLERRVRSMLDRAGSHLPLSRTVGQLLLVSAALIVTSMAVVRPGTNAAGTQPEAAADQPASEQVATEPQGKQPASETNDADENLTISGTVLGPDGTPVAGARVLAVRSHTTNSFRHVTREVLRETESSSDGSFELTVPRRSNRFSNGASLELQHVTVIADAEGFGPDEVHTNPTQTIQDVELQLAPDSTRLEGRIVDLEGRPVQGARLVVAELSVARKSIDQWTERAKENPKTLDEETRGRGTSPPIARFPAGKRIAVQGLPLFQPVRTDSDGRFQIRGLGDDRLVKLRLDRPGFASGWVRAVTHEMQPVSVPVSDPRYRSSLTYGNKFDYTAEPSQLITGTVCDADTGAPLPYVQIDLTGYADDTLHVGGFLSATSDSQGHFELAGVPKPQTGGREAGLRIVPSHDQPYFRRDVRVPQRAGLGPVTLDIRLKRALWVSGQVTNASTGQPVRGLVSYYPFLDNPHVPEHNVFDPGIHSLGYDDQYSTDDEGHFRIPAMPGRGIVRVVAENLVHYHVGAGSDAIEGLRLGDGLNLYHLHWPNRYNTIAEVNAAEGDAEIKCNLSVIPHETIRVEVVDGQGQPLSGVHMAGREPIKGRHFDGLSRRYWTDWVNGSHQFTVILGTDEDRERTLIFYHPERKFGAISRLEDFGFNTTEPQTVALRPCAELAGRFVDGSSKPIAKGGVWAGVGKVQPVYPGEGRKGISWPIFYQSLLDDDGGFTYMLPPGTPYTLLLKGLDEHQDLEIASDLFLHPGERIDLGTIDITADRATWPKPQRSTSTDAISRAETATEVRSEGTLEDDVKRQDATITVRGTVLTPDGKPLAGATVRAATPIWAMLRPIVGRDAKPPTTEVTTSGDGQFTISFSTQPFGDLSRLDQRWRDIWKKTDIVAFASGYGPAWVEYEDIEPGDSVTLKLVEDLPVQGRMVDLEARPVAGATVKVGDLSAAKDENLTPWLDAAKAGELPWTIHKYTPKSIDLETANIPPTVTTDVQGRFEIQGIGQDRHVTLVFEGERVAHQSVTVVTREMEPIERVISTPPFEGTEPVFGAEFTFTAAPSRPIEGTVRDSETGEPMPGVAVDSYKLVGYPFSNHRVLKTTTDEQGRFRLLGMPKGDGNELLAVPNDDQPYFMREVDVPERGGLEPISVDIQLHRGIWISGRITDKNTGKPVHARLYYLPLRSNKYAQAIPEFGRKGNADGHANQSRYHTNLDGSFRLVGLPGRAIVGALSVLKPYRQGVGYEAIDVPKHGDLDSFDTYDNPVLPGPWWPDVMKQINPAEDAELVVVNFEMDPGRSVRINMVDPAGTSIRGVNVQGYNSRGYMDRVEEATYDAINFGPDEERTIVFYHEQRNLGWVARIRSQNGTSDPVTVRLQPCATVTGRLLDQGGAPFTGLVVHANVRRGESTSKDLPSVTTDSEGRFRYTIVPGGKYSLRTRGKGVKRYATIQQELAVEPGATKDLGDFIFRPAFGTFVSRGEGRDETRE